MKVYDVFIKCIFMWSTFNKILRLLKYGMFGSLVV